MKYECVGGPHDGGIEESFSGLHVGDTVNFRISCGSQRGSLQYVMQEDGRLHYAGFKADKPIDQEALDRLMGRTEDELADYLRETVIPALRNLAGCKWGDGKWGDVKLNGMADHLEQLVSERV